MYKVSFRNFLKLFSSKTLAVIIAGFSLLTSMFGLLFLAEHTKHRYYESSDLYKETKTLELNIASKADKETLVRVYKLFTEDNRLPKIDSIQCYSSRSLIGEFRADANFWHVPLGRNITKEEYLDGSQVAIIPIHKIYQMNKSEIESIWDDGIAIDNIFAQVVGAFFGEETNEV